MGVCFTVEGAIYVIAIIGLLATMFLALLTFTKEDDDVSDDNSDK